MGAVDTTYTFTATDTITSAKMNNIIDETVMTGDAVLGGSGGSGGLDIASGKLSISANAINNSRLATNSVTSANIVDGTIVNADINASAAIAGTKISPSFGSQNVTANAFRARGGSPGAGGANNNGYSFSSPGDNDSGMFSSADNSVEFYSNNSEVMRITSGNVGIGTTSPTTKLQVEGTLRLGSSGGEGGEIQLMNTANNAAAAFLDVDSSNVTRLFSSGSTPVAFGTNSTTRVYIESDGDVGIGTNTPQCKLAVTGASGGTDGSGTEGIFQITTGTGANIDDKLQFGVVNSDYSWIQAVDPGTSVRKLILNGAGGNIGINKTNPSTALDVSGTVTATAFAGPLTGNADTVTNGVYTTGTQTIGGAKTFSSAIFLADGGFMFASDGAQDTGMSWNSDGVMNVICNGQVPGQFTTSGWTGNAATATTATTVSNSAITAAKLDGNQSGSAPIFGVRAWVNFDATRDSSGATNTLNTNRFIRSSGNITSVKKEDTGRYTVTFAIPFPSGNTSYTVICTSGQSNTLPTASDPRFSFANRTTATNSSIQIVTNNAGGSSADYNENNVMVIG